MNAYTFLVYITSRVSPICESSLDSLLPCISSISSDFFLSFSSCAFLALISSSMLSITFLMFVSKFLKILIIFSGTLESLYVLTSYDVFSTFSNSSFSLIHDSRHIILHIILH